MAYTQADLDAIDAEIATIRTTKSLAIADRSTTFRDLEEMYAERRRIAQQIATDAGTPGHIRYATTDKGF